jgi:hypothetical protein
MTDRMAIVAGAAVQTPLGKGVVREVRNSGRLLVDLVNGRAVEIEAALVTRLEAGRSSKSGTPPRMAGSASADRATSATPAAAAAARKTGSQSAPRFTSASSGRAASSEVDLHGLTVEQALTRAEQALNDALLADLPELRLVHGRSGGRIRAALHRRLREISSVRGFRLDPHNPGVTIVAL